MSPRVRYLITTVCLVALPVGYMAWQRQVERPSPRLLAASVPGGRALAPPRISRPSEAREILERAEALELREDQIRRLHELDRLWRVESGRLEEAIRQEEGEVGAFMEQARTSRGASVQEIERRSAELRTLGARLREARQQHSDAAARLLTEWQRKWLASGGSAGSSEEIGRER